MIVCVLGATGGTGREVTRAALAAGHSVRALVRTPAKLGEALDREGGLHARALPLVIDAMREHGARRLVVVSGAGVDAPGDRKGLGPKVLGRALRLIAGSAMADRQREADLVMASGLEWVLVRPPHLVDGPETGRVRAGTDLQLGLRDQLARADLGRFLVEQLTDARFVGRAPFVAAQR